MRVVRALLAVEVVFYIAGDAIGARARAVFLRAKALVRGPRFYQRAIDTDVVLRQQPAPLGQAHHLGEQRRDCLVFQGGRGSC